MEIFELPGCILFPSRSEKFFWGIPFVGVDKRIFRRLRRFQQKRDRTIETLWPHEEKTLSAKKVVDEILLQHFAWVNTLFHPRDRVNALFFYPYGDLEDAVGYGKILEFNEKFEKIDNLNEMTYLELLEMLAC